MDGVAEHSSRAGTNPFRKASDYEGCIVKRKPTLCRFDELAFRTFQEPIATGVVILSCWTAGAMMSDREVHRMPIATLVCFVGHQLANKEVVCYKHESHAVQQHDHTRPARVASFHRNMTRRIGIEYYSSYAHFDDRLGVAL